MPDKLGQRSKRKKGQALVELMVAMSIMTIGLLAVFAVLSQAFGLNRVIANQYVASNLAAEGIEVVKNIADSNVINDRPWNSGLATNGNFGVEYDSEFLDPTLTNLTLSFNPTTGLYSYNDGTPTNFKRIITITNISANEIQVNSRVEWVDRGKIKFEINVEDRFYNWHL